MMRYQFFSDTNFGNFLEHLDLRYSGKKEVDDVERTVELLGDPPSSQLRQFAADMGGAEVD